jgi:hypothetical protein
MMKTQCIDSNNDAEFPTYLFPVHAVSRTKNCGVSSMKPFKRNILVGFVRQRSANGDREYCCFQFIESYVNRV